MLNPLWRSELLRPARSRRVRAVVVRCLAFGMLMAALFLPRPAEALLRRSSAAGQPLLADSLTNGDAPGDLPNATRAGEASLVSNVCDRQHPDRGNDTQGHQNPACLLLVPTASVTPTPPPNATLTFTPTTIASGTPTITPSGSPGVPTGTSTAPPSPTPTPVSTATPTPTAR